MKHLCEDASSQWVSGNGHCPLLKRHDLYSEKNERTESGFQLKRRCASGWGKI